MNDLLFDCLLNAFLERTNALVYLCVCVPNELLALWCIQIHNQMVDVQSYNDCVYERRSSFTHDHQKFINLMIIEFLNIRIVNFIFIVIMIFGTHQIACTGVHITDTASDNYQLIINKSVFSLMCQICATKHIVEIDNLLDFKLFEFIILTFYIFFSFITKLRLDCNRNSQFGFFLEKNAIQA